MQWHNSDRTRNIVDCDGHATTQGRYMAEHLINELRVHPGPAMKLYGTPTPIPAHLQVCVVSLTAVRAVMTGNTVSTGRLTFSSLVWDGQDWKHLAERMERELSDHTAESIGDEEQVTVVLSSREYAEWRKSRFACTSPSSTSSFQGILDGRVKKSTLLPSPRGKTPSTASLDSNSLTRLTVVAATGDNAQSTDQDAVSVTSSHAGRVLIKQEAGSPGGNAVFTADVSVSKMDTEESNELDDAK